MRFCRIQVSSWQVPAEVLELRKSQESDALKGNANQLQNAADKGSIPISMSAPAVETGGRDSVALRTSGAAVSSSALDLVKKKLQDAGTPITSSPLPTSGPVASDLNGSKAVETAAKGQQGTNSKDKVKDDGNMSDSSSDSDDEESGPTKEECIIQFKVCFFLFMHSVSDLLEAPCQLKLESLVYEVYILLFCYCKW